MKAFIWSAVALALVVVSLAVFVADGQRAPIEVTAIAKPLTDMAPRIVAPRLPAEATQPIVERDQPRAIAPAIVMPTKMPDPRRPLPGTSAPLVVPSEKLVEPDPFTPPVLAVNPDRGREAAWESLRAATRR